MFVIRIRFILKIGNPGTDAGVLEVNSYVPDTGAAK